MRYRSPSYFRETAPDSSGTVQFQVKAGPYEPGGGDGSLVFLSGPRLLGGASAFTGPFAPGPGGGATRSGGNGRMRGTSGGASRFGGATRSGGNGRMRGTPGGASRFGGATRSGGRRRLGVMTGGATRSGGRGRLGVMTGGASWFGGTAIGSYLGFRGAFSISTSFG
jgi:hypothetical protein